MILTIPDMDGNPVLAIDAPDLTPTEQRIVAAIMVLTARRGRPPTVRGIANYLCCTHGFIWQYLVRLRRKKWVAKLSKFRECATTRLIKKPVFREIVQ